MENLSGQNIKDYELQERLGTGGFGAVYKAHQTTVGREVAVKVILPALPPNQISSAALRLKRCSLHA